MICSTKRLRVGAVVGLLAAPALCVGSVPAALQAKQAPAIDHTTEWRPFRTLWCFKVATWGKNYISDIVQYRDGIIYACDAHVGCLNKLSGRLMWRCPFPADHGTEQKGAETHYGGSEPQDGWKLKVEHGLLYARNNRSKHVHCIDIGTGKRIWDRISADAPDIHGYTWANVRWELPYLNGVKRHLHSIESLCTLVMTDRNGNEQWRWQPYDGFMIQTILSDGQRLVVSDGDSIQAVRQGVPDPLPSDVSVRRDVARWMVLALTGGLNTDGKPVRRPSILGHRPGLVVPGDNEAKLTILRLGSISVAPLLDFVRRNISESERDVLDTVSKLESPYREWDQLSGVLDLVADIGDHGCVPTLIHLLDRTKDRRSRQCLANTLIRLNDIRAAPALFRYAQCVGDRVYTRQDALYYICRVPNSVFNQREVTDYLLTSLANSKTPTWLRVFARFELLNNRGPKARSTALAAFAGEGPAQIIPPNVNIKDGDDASHLLDPGPIDFPTIVRLSAPLIDKSGIRWAAFRSGYLGDVGDLWLARSTDGTSWTHPVFAMNLTTKCAPGNHAMSAMLREDSGGLAIDWVEESDQRTGEQVKHHERLSFADLDRDSDGDGLTDLLEQEIGSDPHKRSTRDDGISDGVARNPGYRPHVLSDDEGIYQSAVEALCQVGRARLEHQHADDLPFRFGGTRAPLVLHLPPGSAGISIMGHPGPIVFRRFLNTVDEAALRAFFPGSGKVRFISPHIDLQGVYHQQLPGDPTSVAPTQYVTWRQYFPYVLSQDGTRARVGWEQEEGNGERQWTVGYDIEARKIDGEWVPIECRHVTLSRSFLSASAVRDAEIVAIPDGASHGG